MPVFRSTEARVLPGRRAAWIDNVRALKGVLSKHGVALRTLELLYGGTPGTVIVSAAADDLPALAAREASINADADYRAVLARITSAGAPPTAEPIEARILEDITQEVGGARATFDTASVFQIITMRLRPGRRGKQIEMIRQMREARLGAGRPLSNVIQVLAGDTTTLGLIRGYADLAAWAKDRGEGEPKGAADILTRVQADPQFPYADPVATRVFRDISAEI